MLIQIIIIFQTCCAKLIAEVHNLTNIGIKDSTQNLTNCIYDYDWLFAIQCTNDDNYFNSTFMKQKYNLDVTDNQKHFILITDIDSLLNNSRDRP